MIFLFVFLGLAVIAAVALLMRRDQPLLAPDPIPGRPFGWPPEQGTDAPALLSVRFPVALRGYRMAEVDEVLADCATALADRDAALAERDALIAQLQGRI